MARLSTTHIAHGTYISFNDEYLAKYVPLLVATSCMKHTTSGSYVASDQYKYC